MKKFTLLFVLWFVAFAMNLNAQTPPANLQILDYGYDYAVLSAQANATGDNILIAVTDVPKMNAYNQIIEGGTFGTPQGTYQLNDEIDGGGKVVYIGSASENIEIEDLNDNVIYHFQAWSVDGSGIYSTDYLTADFITWGKVPYVSNYAILPLGEIPPDWTVTGGDIYKQNTSWGTSWLQQTAISGSPSNPAVMTLTTQWILLNEKRNQISFDYYLSNPLPYGGMYLNFTSEDWETGSTLEVQVSNDDVDYVSVYTINKDNAYDFEHPRSQANLATLMTPPFDNFKGERVKVRIKWNFVQQVQTHMEDLHVDLVVVEECDGIYGLTADPLVGGEAEISWDSFDDEADLWEIRYRVLDEEDGEWTEPVEINTNPYLMTGLPFETRIEIQVRVKCSSELFSDWLSFIFTTGLEFPPCEYPVNLSVNSITSTTASLSWEEGDEGNLSWDLRYRDAISTSWVDIEEIEEKTYLLDELTENTAYIWTVRARCIGDQTSTWATQSNFTTEPDGIGDSGKEKITVYASGKMLSIINPENRYIEKIQLFSITGSLLGDFTVNSTDNVLITTNLSEMIILVNIIGQNETASHKVLLR